MHHRQSTLRTDRRGCIAPWPMSLQCRGTGGTAALSAGGSHQDADPRRRGSPCDRQAASKSCSELRRRCTQPVVVYLMTLIFSMTTGVVGTSLLKGPCAPVGTALILSTTSRPEITLPNTV